MTLPDIQNQKGDFKYRLKAGVSGLKIPILVKNQDDGLVQTIADIDMHVRLDRDTRGINMSRLPIIAAGMTSDHWVVDNLKAGLIDMLAIMESDAAEVVMKFPYFYEKMSPTTRHSGIAHADITFTGFMDKYEGQFIFILTVKSPVMTLCPCSKEISENSAHNQRAEVEISVFYGNKFVWIEDIIEIAEFSASSGVYPILKRPDEKYVTEFSYNKPRFVEDVARHAAELIEKRKEIQAYHVKVRSFESIHQHDATAEVSGGLVFPCLV